jgi:hypothetical protein
MHWLFIGRDRAEAIFLRRGLRLGILHRPLEGWQELGSAFFGPVAGLLSSLCIGFVMSIMMAWPAVWFISLSCGFFHLISLLPIYGDGQAIMQQIRTTYEK